MGQERRVWERFFCFLNLFHMVQLPESGQEDRQALSQGTTPRVRTTNCKGQLGHGSKECNSSDCELGN